MRRCKKLKGGVRYVVFPRAKGRLGDGIDRVFFEVDGELYLSVYHTALAASEPDFYSYLDQKYLQGKEHTH